MKKILSLVVAAFVAMTMSAEAISVAEALQIAGQLEKGATTEEEYEIEGYVTAMQGSEDGGWAQYGNQNFWIADDKESTAKTNADGALEIYQGVASEQVYVGDKVSVKAKLTNYNDLLETAKRGAVTILEKAERPEPPVEEEADVVFTGADFYGQGTSGTGSPVSATKDNITFACDKAYCDSANATLRCYKNGVITISSEKEQISKLVFQFFSTYTGDLENEVVVNAKEWSYTLTNQARIQKLSIYFGEIEPIDTIVPGDPIAVTCAEAAAVMPAQKGDTTVATYIVTGYVTETNGNLSRGQQCFWLDDVKGGEKIIQGYWCNIPEGEDPLKVGDKITMTGRILNYNNTPEIKNGDVVILERAEVIPPVESDTIEVNVAKAVEVSLALDRGAKTEELYAVTGYIHSIATEYSAQYGNISFWMADEKDAEESKFQAYRVKCTEAEAAKLGANAKVTVIANLQHYFKVDTESGDTIDIPEAAAGGALVILDTDTVEPIDPSEPIAVTCAEAAAVMPAQKGDTTVATYIVTGYVTETNGNLSRGQQCFWLDDVKGGEKIIQGYWCNIPEGEDPLKVGDKITMTGRILNYNNTPEIKNGDVVILERAEVVPADTTKECEVLYVDIDEAVIGKEKVTLHIPAAPEIEDFIFIGWQTVEAFIDKGIIIQAIYEYTGDESVAPAEVKVDDARKLIRNGNVYILRDEKVYTITGQQVR